MVSTPSAVTCRPNCLPNCTEDTSAAALTSSLAAPQTKARSIFNSVNGVEINPYMLLYPLPKSSCDSPNPLRRRRLVPM